MSQLLQLALPGRRHQHHEGQRRHLQKICLYYDALFDISPDVELSAMGDDSSTSGPSSKQKSQQRVDWNEVFLLEVNGDHLKTLIQKHKRCPHSLFNQAIQMFLKHSGSGITISPGGSREPLQIASPRQTDDQSQPLSQQLKIQMLVHCIQTLDCLLKAVYSLQLQSQGDFINFFTTLQQADKQFTRLAYCISTALVHHVARVQLVAVNLLITVVSGSDNLNGNPLLQYILAIPLTTFVPLLRVRTLSTTPMPADELAQLDVTVGCQSEVIARIIAVAMGLLMNYRKYEHHNPLINQLQDLFMANEAFLSTIHSTFILSIRSLVEDEQHGGRQQTASSSSITDLTRSTVGYFYSLFQYYYNSSERTDAVTAPPQRDNNNSHYRHLKPPHSSVASLLLLYEAVHNHRDFFLDILSPPNDKLGLNIIGSLIVLASHLFQKSSDLRQMAYSKLLLLIFNLLLQNRSVMTVLCSAETHLSLCRLRRPRLPLVSSDRLSAYTCYLLDAYLLFLRHNLRRRLQSDLYSQCLNGIGTIILHLCRQGLRLQYHWQALYATLINVMHYIISHAKDLHDRPFLYPILESLIALFNLVITHGDSFLPDTASYDDCYYEIIRNAELFTKCRVMLQTVESGSKQQKKDPAADFTNIQSIISNLLPTSNGSTSEGLAGNNEETTPLGDSSVGISEMPQSTDEVYAAIRAHYESMELKIVSRALFELRFDKSYREYPAEVNYFRWLLRTAVKDLRHLSAESAFDFNDNHSGATAAANPSAAIAGDTDFPPLLSPDDRGEIRRSSWDR